ncbi:hypothetical protein [Stackebrandtia soli]|uniref:hypothetical protein n=1 Tax=Stackebrandtia soli TaxID=1892856 RepID=UPI0039ECC216
MIAVLRAGWVKVGSLRSSSLLLLVPLAAALIALWVFAGAIASADELAAGARTSRPLSAMDQLVMPLTQLCAVVFGATLTAGEYVHRTISSTMVASPCRWRWSVSVAIWAGGLSASVGAVVGAITVIGSARIADGRTVPGVTGVDVASQVLWHSAAVAATAVLAVGIALSARSVAVPVVTATALIALLPMGALLVPPPWGDRLSALTPFALAGRLADRSDVVAALPPVLAGLILCGYAVVPLVVGVSIVLKRDI